MSKKMMPADAGSTEQKGKPVRAEAPAGFYRDGVELLEGAGIQFLVGGGYALSAYTGVARRTKDLDVFVRPNDAQGALDALAAAGFRTELTFPHWLGKAFSDRAFIDVIFSSGNGIALVDDEWFQHAPLGEVLGRSLRLCPPEEMIWSKSYVGERERYDGADVMHLLRACGETLDWERLLRRFGRTWRVLLSHLVLFGFVYPGPRERSVLPQWVMTDLLRLLQEEQKQSRVPQPAGEVEQVCQGTLLSREQYLSDIEQFGYRDGRLEWDVRMTPADIVHWTNCIEGRHR
ncbi:MAG TPA: hypothetical protein VFH73_07570 [Polyangia bacterium]|nr:hypothetical protein [Polyangia bacterium]